MQQVETQKTELKGIHVLGIMVFCFSVIIGVNLFMAYNAVSSFPGLVVKNGYIASQSFDRKRAAQDALGLQTGVAYVDGLIELGIVASAQNAPHILRLEAVIGRPAQDSTDQTLPLRAKGTGLYIAPMDLAQGKWLVQIEGTMSDGTPFEQTLDLIVR